MHSRALVHSGASLYSSILIDTYTVYPVQEAHAKDFWQLTVAFRNLPSVFAIKHNPGFILFDDTG